MLRLTAPLKTGQAALPRTEHILLESDERAVPDRRTARKAHAHLRFRSRLRRRTFVLDVFDYYFLSVQTWRGRSIVGEYVLDLRFIDPVLGESRHVSWRWILATLGSMALLGGAIWWVSESSASWWRHELLPVCAILAGLTFCAGAVALYRTTETLCLQSLHGRARALEIIGGLGSLHAIRPFITRLAAHVQIAVAARRPSLGEHLRDEMREHYRLKEAGVLRLEDYESSKARILRTHAPA